MDQILSVPPPADGLQSHSPSYMSIHFPEHVTGQKQFCSEPQAFRHGWGNRHPTHVRLVSLDVLLVEQVLRGGFPEFGTKKEAVMRGPR